MLLQVKKSSVRVVFYCLKKNHKFRYCLEYVKKAQVKLQSA